MRIELILDPFDLTDIEVKALGTSVGAALPHHVGRHAHPKASPETPAELAPSTGIDCLRILDETHAANTAKSINYASLMDDSREQSMIDRVQGHYGFTRALHPGRSGGQCSQPRDRIRDSISFRTLCWYVLTYLLTSLQRRPHSLSN